MAMSRKNTTSAVSAFSVICSPHVGLTVETLTSSAGMPDASASASRTATSTSGGWSPVWTRSRTPSVPESSWIFASRSAIPLSLEDRPPRHPSRGRWPASSHETPPSKSMPRFSWRVRSDPKRDQQQDQRDGEPDLAPADEVERGLTVVEPVPQRSAGAERVAARGSVHGVERGHTAPPTSSRCSEETPRIRWPW